jgi:hypothetical protein
LNAELARFGANVAEGVAAYQARPTNSRAAFLATDTLRNVIDDLANGARSATDDIARAGALFQDGVGDDTDSRSQKHYGFDRKRIERHHFE